MRAQRENKSGAKGLLWWAALVLIAILVVYGGNLLHPADTDYTAADRVTVHFIDVGQGCATLIQSGTEGILVDAGEAVYAGRVIGYLHECGIRSLVFVVASHPHADHIGALPDVMRAFPTGAVILPRLSKENIPATTCYEHLLQTIQSEKIKAIAAKPQSQYSLPNVTMTVLSPLVQDSELNNMSVVCTVRAFDTLLLLTADAETAAQQRLVEAGSGLRCDVLQVPHHGSDNALCEALLDLAHPQAAVISCGKNNDYGHPHRAVLAALSQRGAEIYRTDEQSTVTVSCYADGYRVDTAK